MPKKRSAGPPAIGNLSAALVNVILTGDDPDDEFFRFTVDLLEGGDYLPRLYRENQDALLAEFRRRGLPGNPWIVGETR
jgi:hypothetical protein